MSSIGYRIKSKENKQIRFDEYGNALINIKQEKTGANITVGAKDRN